MSQSFRLHPRAIGPALLAGVFGAASIVTAACNSEPAGIAGGGGSSGRGGSSGNATGGTHHAGEAGEGTGGSGQSGSAGTEQGGSAGSGTATGGDANGGTDATGGSDNPGGGEGGEDPGGMGGDGNETGGTSGVGGSGGPGGSGGAGGSGTTTKCLFHSAPMGASTAQGGMAGAGGMAGSAGMAGGAGAPAADVNVRTSPFVGSYLADATGRTLFFYGADLTGDCQANNPPVSRCTADCLTSWPIFNAGPRALGAGLDDAAFGTIERSPGVFQTTYHGWPLYYYKDDLTPGQMTGQGKARIWHVAEVKLPTIVIMREGTVRYLADTAGHTLYVSSGDQVGNDSQDPISNCSGSCLGTFQRVVAPRFSVVQSLETDDFWTFTNPGGPPQLAFRGAPLYRAHADLQAGDVTGTATPGFTWAVVP